MNSNGLSDEPSRRIIAVYKSYGPLVGCDHVIRDVNLKITEKHF